MKVAFLTMGKDIGGAKQDVLTLSQKIAAHGHDVFVIAAPGVMDRELTGTILCSSTLGIMESFSLSASSRTGKQYRTG